MGFIKFSPLGNNKCMDAFTTHDREKHLWQELTALRHSSDAQQIEVHKKVSPWIDQAKLYYIDASKSDWRSAGLLYYYSFLQLAKAHIVASRSGEAEAIMSSSAFHGLHADLQDPHQIKDYTLNIHPPISRKNGKINIFSRFYETFTKSSWPHETSISIKLEEILGYCTEISFECQKFFGITPQVLQVQSLIREVDNKSWFELVTTSDFMRIIMSDMSHLDFEVISPSDLSSTDKRDWLAAYERTMQSLAYSQFLRTKPIELSENDTNHDKLKLMVDIDNVFKGRCIALPNAEHTDRGWKYSSFIDISGKKTAWHPVLSDYLFSFALSTILRYQPQLLAHDSRDSFLAESWCNQSAVSVLRYYLMSLTTPPLRLN